MQRNDEKYGKRLHEEADLMKKLTDEQHAEETSVYHKSLNFVLPHELGGCGSAFFEPEKDIYSLFNIYAEKGDLAVIEPRWTTKDEFKVKLPRNKALDEALEDVEAEEPYSALPRTSSMVRESIVSNITDTRPRKPAIFTKPGQEDYARRCFPRPITADFEKHELPDLNKRLAEAKQAFEIEQKSRDRAKAAFEDKVKEEMQRLRQAKAGGGGHKDADARKPRDQPEERKRHERAKGHLRPPDRRDDSPEGRKRHDDDDEYN